ncbi:TIR domain-containing protein [Candidatus Poribacteria bacterium]|nr:TIR domain-containing protein [Candidatus Poribacteria bacterium]
MKDFFISYNRADKEWAEWIAWVLEEDGYTVVIQAWDFRPGGNFVLDMQRAAAETEKTIAVLSDNYLDAEYTQPEWAAAFARDPQGKERTLIPYRVKECIPMGLLKPIGYVDLVNLSELPARKAVLGAFDKRAKPADAPAFPGAKGASRIAPNRVQYPGISADSIGELEPEGGAIPLDSPFYVQRHTDEEFNTALTRGDSIVLVKGARQVGKTSLLARGLQRTRETGAEVILTDFQKLNTTDFESIEIFFLTLAEWIAEQLNLHVFLDKIWNPRHGPNMGSAIHVMLFRDCSGKENI